MRARRLTGAGDQLRLVVVFCSVVDPRQPRRETFDRDLELRVEVDELPHALGEQVDAHLLVTPAPLQFLDASIGEVHGGPGLVASREGPLDDGVAAVGPVRVDRVHLVCGAYPLAGDNGGAGQATPQEQQAS